MTKPEHGEVQRPFGWTTVGGPEDKVRYWVKALDPAHTEAAATFRKAQQIDPDGVLSAEGGEIILPHSLRLFDANRLFPFFVHPIPGLAVKLRQFQPPQPLPEDLGQQRLGE